MPAVPQVQLVIWSLAVLGAPGFMLALRLGRAYTHAWNASRASLFDAILRDQLLYVTYSMMALGFVALMIWEGVFPDRRDVRILGVLPLSTRTHVAGRLAGLGAFAALFSVGINLPSAVAYGLVLFVLRGRGRTGAHRRGPLDRDRDGRIVRVLPPDPRAGCAAERVRADDCAAPRAGAPIGLCRRPSASADLRAVYRLSGRRCLPQRPAVDAPRCCRRRGFSPCTTSWPARVDLSTGHWLSQRLWPQPRSWSWGRCSSPRATGVLSASRSKRLMVAGMAARSFSVEPHGRWPASFVLVPFSAPWPGSRCGALDAVALI